MKPRVLVVAPSAYTLGGLATWLDYLGPGLRRLGWRVTVGLVQGPRFHEPSRYIDEHPMQDWLPIRCLSGTPEGRLRALCRVIEHLRPRIVVAVNVPDVYPAVQRLRVKGEQVSSVMTLHGIQPDLLSDARFYARQLDGVICTNRLLCRLAVCEGKMNEKRVHYAPYGVTIEPFSPGRPSGSRFRIAWVGRLDEREKRVLDLPPIMEHLRQLEMPFQVLIAGDGPDELLLRERLQHFVDRKEAVFMGRLDPEDLRSVYSEADALLVTSPSETGPQVIWEAMSGSLPVVSSRYIGSGLEAALEHGTNALLFPVGESYAASLQLSRLWRDPGLCRRIAEEGHKTASDRYSIEASLRYWDSALTSVLRGRPLKTPPSSENIAGSGRLDRWLGDSLAETLRGLTRRRANPMGGPGGEWPHSHSSCPTDAFNRFSEIAEETDSRPSRPSHADPDDRETSCDEGPDTLSHVADPRKSTLSLHGDASAA